MKHVSKLGTIITKIAEVFHWVGAALMAASTVCSLSNPEWVELFVSFDAKDCCGTNLEVYGFEVNAPVINGITDMATFFLFGIGATIILIVMAMVFRNLYLIYKNSENATPFRENNIRLMRRTGIFSIAVPIIGIFMSLIIRLVAGVDATESSMDMSGIFMGVIILSLTQFFSHGAELEKDVDGLV